jgi:hypothetical protein
MEMPSFDPRVFAVVPVALVAMAALSADLPARRASRIDPAQTLRRRAWSRTSFRFSCYNKHLP